MFITYSASQVNKNGEQLIFYMRGTEMFNVYPLSHHRNSSHQLYDKTGTYFAMRLKDITRLPVGRDSKFIVK